MSKLRVVFMGTPDFAVPCLRMLINESYDVAGVVTQPDRPKGRGQKLTPSPVKKIAQQYKLNVLTPLKIKTPECIADLSALKPDVIVVVAFGQFLSKELLDLPALGCINVHASLLPLYRGAAPIHWAIINGEATTGITTMYMDKGMDTGNMILKESIAVSSDDTTEQLHDKLKIIGAQVLSKTLHLIASHSAPSVPQDNELATYAPLLTREIEHINWQQPADRIYNLVRGLNSWPGAYSIHQGKILKIWRTAMGPINNKDSQPGTIIDVNTKTLVVQTGRGTLELLEIQPESKRRMSAADYIKGHGLCVGDILG